jgi:membrane-bound metal-dependent hydrolase YbcI (DUF457 family)
MPSPIGHALGGLAAGWFVEGLSGVRRSPLTWTAGGFVLAGTLPDIDLLFGVHRGPTHSLGSALIVGLAAAAATRDLRFPLAVAAAYASHTLLDWVAQDTTPPIGVMALWPLTRQHYKSHGHVFDAISRRYWLPGFWSQNFAAVLRELAILAPLAALTGMWRWRRSIATRRQAARGSRPGS